VLVRAKHNEINANIEGHGMSESGPLRQTPVISRVVGFQIHKHASLPKYFSETATSSFGLTETKPIIRGKRSAPKKACEGSRKNPLVPLFGSLAFQSLMQRHQKNCLRP
jgi:hypothetical protein